MIDGGLQIRDPVIPIATIERIEDAVPLARALAEGGLHALEVTLRTPVALAAIERIAVDVPDLTVGAGTVLGEDQIDAAKRAGAQFLVTPAGTPRLLDSLEGSGLPFLCGCATPSEIAAVMERGIRQVKIFPAEAIGGVEYVKALAGPFPDVQLFPTGGIGPEKAPAYLDQSNVAAVGGSWLTQLPRGSRDFEEVVTAARDALLLRRAPR